MSRRFPMRTSLRKLGRTGFVKVMVPALLLIVRPRQACKKRKMDAADQDWGRILRRSPAALRGGRKIDLRDRLRRVVDHEQRTRGRRDVAGGGHRHRQSRCQTVSVGHLDLPRAVVQARGQARGSKNPRENRAVCRESHGTCPLGRQALTAAPRSRYYAQYEHTQIEHTAAQACRAVRAGGSGRSEKPRETLQGLRREQENDSAGVPGRNEDELREVAAATAATSRAATAGVGRESDGSGFGGGL